MSSPGGVVLLMARLSANASSDVVSALARRLAAAGHVAPTFEKAALARERRSPTGLPFSPVPVALPHAEPEHVVSPAIAIATFARPVTFRQMGAPQIELACEIALMPAFSAKEQASAGLSRLLELLQDEGLRHALVGAPDDAALAVACAPLAEACAALAALPRGGA